LPSFGYVGCMSSDSPELILVRQREKLNVAQIRSELIPLPELKGDNEAGNKCGRLLSTVERRLGAKS